MTRHLLRAVPNQRLGLALLVAFSALCLQSSEAQATTTCSYDPSSRVLEVRFTKGPGGFDSDLYVDEQSQEIGTVTGTDLDCEGPTPTVQNVDRIEVFDRSGRANEVQLIDPHSFARPSGGGVRAAAPGPIEFEIRLGPERNDFFELLGTAEADGGWRLGGAGLDLSGSSEDEGLDLGLAHRGVDRYLVRLGFGNDRFSAMGGRGTGEPFGANLIVEGSLGNDVLTGSPGSDYLYGASGEDELYGRRGADRLNGNYEPDLLSGGPGNDSAIWPSGVGDDLRVDIGAGGANDGSARDDHQDNVVGDVENLFGGGDEDVLIGDAEPNVLVGGDDADLLIGRGGGDVLIDASGNGNAGDVFRAGSGDDLVIAHDDFRDRDIDCADGTDHLFTDSLDSKGADCEKRRREEGPLRWLDFASIFW